MNQLLDDVDRAIKDIAAGRPVLVVDDENRENEGDIIFAASMATPELLAFMIRYTSGVICVPMREAELDRLQLPQMTAHNTEHHRTAFTVSVDARDRISTGISAADRAATIAKLVDPGHHGGRPGAPRPRVPAPLRRGRRAAPPRSHRGRRGPGPAGRAAGGGRALRGGERRRHDGPAARAPRVRQHPRPRADLDRAADRVPPAHRAPAEPPGADPDPERPRPVAGVRLPARDRRDRAHGAGARRRPRRERADQAALGVPDR